MRSFISEKGADKFLNMEEGDKKHVWSKFSATEQVKLGTKKLAPLIYKTRTICHKAHQYHNTKAALEMF